MVRSRVEKKGERRSERRGSRLKRMNGVQRPVIPASEIVKACSACLKGALRQEREGLQVERSELGSATLDPDELLYLTLSLCMDTGRKSNKKMEEQRWSKVARWAKSVAVLWLSNIVTHGLGYA